MKEITILNNVKKLIDKMNYEYAYIEIATKDATHKLDLSKKSSIGFRRENQT